MHTAVEDHSRLAYAEILPAEKGSTCSEFLLRAAAWFAGHGMVVREVITDNAKNYILSRDFAVAMAAIGAKPRRIKPHCPWQNGKVARFNRTLARVGPPASARKQHHPQASTGTLAAPRQH